MPAGVEMAIRSQPSFVHFPSTNRLADATSLIGRCPPDDEDEPGPDDEDETASETQVSPERWAAFLMMVMMMVRNAVMMMMMMKMMMLMMMLVQMLAIIVMTAIALLARKALES